MPKYENKKKVKMSLNKIIIALWLVKIYGATDGSTRVTSGLLPPEFMNPKQYENKCIKRLFNLCKMG